MKRERLAQIARLVEGLAETCPSNASHDLRPWGEKLSGLFELCMDGTEVRKDLLDEILVDEVAPFASALKKLRGFFGRGWTHGDLPKAAQHLRDIGKAIRATLR